MKKSPKSKLLIVSMFVCCLYSGALVAQNREVSQIEYSTESQKQETKSNSRNAIKLNPLLFLRGDIPIYFEKNITDKIFIEIGAGVTFRDYLTSTNYNLDDDHDLEYDVKLGYSYRIGLRYYAADFSYEPYGFYFGLSYQSQNYRSVLTSLNDLEDLNNDIKTHNKDFRLEIGYVTTFEESVFLEPYIGLGIRSRKFDEITIDSNNSNVYEIEKTNDIVPFLSAGVKIGFSF